MFVVLPNKVDGLGALESKMSGTFMDQVDQVIGTAKYF